jgi:hypothetical protein
MQLMETFKSSEARSEDKCVKAEGKVAIKRLLPALIIQSRPLIARAHMN